MESDFKDNIYSELIKHLGGQVKAAYELGVNQSTVSNYKTGRHTMSALVAMRAEKITGGKFKAVDLCPAIKRCTAVGAA